MEPLMWKRMGRAEHLIISTAWPENQEVHQGLLVGRSATNSEFILTFDVFAKLKKWRKNKTSIHGFFLFNGKNSSIMARMKKEITAMAVRIVIHHMREIISSTTKRWRALAVILPYWYVLACLKHNLKRRVLILLLIAGGGRREHILGSRFPTRWNPRGR